MKKVLSITVAVIALLVCKAVAELELIAENAQYIASSGNGQKMIYTKDGDIYLYDGASRYVGEGEMAVLSPDGNFVMYPISEGNVTLYNTNNGQRHDRTVIGEATAVDDEGATILSLDRDDCRSDSNDVGCAAYMNYPSGENPPILLGYIHSPSISANGEHYAYEEGSVCVARDNLLDERCFGSDPVIDNSGDMAYWDGDGVVLISKGSIANSDEVFTISGNGSYITYLSNINVYLYNTVSNKNIRLFVLENGNIYLDVPGEPVTASSHQTTPEYHPPEHAVDGNLNTRWSARGSGEWLQLDLGEVQLVSVARVAWLWGYKRTAYFSIETSYDGLVWQEVYKGQSTGLSDNQESYNFEGVEARYVRLVGRGTNVNDWNSVLEFEVGIGASGASASSAQVGNEAVGAIDGNWKTRWSARGPEQWIVVELDYTARVDGVRLNWLYGDRLTTMRIEYENESGEWIELFSGKSQGKKGKLEAYLFDEVVTDKIRVTGSGNTKNDWTSINEIQVLTHGEP